MPPDSAGVALVTGCSSGIGRATVRRFLAGDWTVWATARNPGDVDDLARLGSRTAALDVTDEEQVTTVVDTVLERDGRIDCLVNNAGFGQAGAVEEVPVDRLRAQFDVNAFGPIRLAQAVLPHMRTAGGGTIVNVSSLLGRVSYPMRGAYAGSKHALEAMSDVLRAEVTGFDVDVVLVEPGSVRTGFDDRLRESRTNIDEQPVYGRLRRVVDAAQRLSARTGVPPDRVAAVVYEAAATDDPNSRYVVGWDARTAILVDRIVPSRVTDWLYGKLL